MIPTDPAEFASNWDILRTLLVKDWRVARVPVVAMVVLGIGCYVIPLLAMWFADEPSSREVSENLLKCAQGGAVVTAMVAAVLGGGAIAGERADRTAGFVDLLPVTRGRIILSKWIVSFAILAVSAVCHGIVALLVNVWMNPAAYMWIIRVHPTPELAMWLGIASGLFGVAWMLGSFLDSAVISSCVAIAVTAAIILGLNLHQSAPYKTAIVTFASGFAGSVVGILYYLRRVKP